MGRFDQRQAFLVSATVHLMLLTLLSSREFRPSTKPAPPREDLSRATRVLLPPPEVLRQMAPRAAPQPRPPAQPVPSATPEPPQAKAKDRISIGPPSTERAKDLILRREDDLTKVPKGTPNARPTAAPTPPAATATADAPPPGSTDPDTPGATGLKLPPGLGALDRGDGATRKRPGEQGPEKSISSSLRNLEQRYQDLGPSGLATGVGQQMGPLSFDPMGADFTVWINHFKNEVYRNWIVPQPALLGFRGHVDIEFTVERDGSISSLRMLKSAGTLALDRAAINALQGSRFMKLPADYGPPRCTMLVGFYYNEGPQGS